eukprot:TRINITY_DN2876_c0_g3_i1.p1 TRINITY_DN2876_c0_g3~~TRINITY_DN2876_c0_g3_i1.p1  ORF type:complete len:166 (-),score=74.58 TRINITY_DN2876_c0_g3_i1:158-604(-)
MADLGVRCEDRPGARSVWKLDDPNLLRQEREEKVKKAAADALNKLKSKIAAKAKEVEKWEAASLPPAEVLHATGKYSAADGAPTHDAAGKELSGKGRKAAEKEWKKAEEAYAKFLEKQREHGSFLESLKAELAEVQAELCRATTALSS